MRPEHPLLLALLLASFDAIASERLVRQVDQRTGLSVTHVSALAQDAERFLWVGTPGGLLRYDGTRLVPVPGSSAIGHLHACGTEVWAVAGYERRLYRVERSGLRGLEVAPGVSLQGVTDVQGDGMGRLWVAAGGQRWVREQGAWRQVPGPPFSGEQVRFIRPAPSGEQWVGTDQAVWRVTASGEALRLGEVRALTVLIPTPEGGAMAGTFDGRVLEARDGALVERLRLPERITAIVFRHSTAWVASADRLVALREGAEPEVLGPDQVPSGGPLLVDHEGSLWLGTFRGLWQFPEPETFAFNRGDGLPSAHSRFLVRAGDSLWFTTWSGSGRLERRGRWAVVPVPTATVNHPLCGDAEGRVWGGDWSEALEERDGTFVRHLLAPGDVYSACASSRNGGVWLGFGRNLYRATRGVPGLVGTLPLGEGREGRLDVLFEDRSGTLWAAMGERVCSIHPSQLTPHESPWSCHTLPGAYHVTSLFQTEAGTLWAATRQQAVQRWTGQAWRVIPAALHLATRDVLGLAPSPRGGVWVSGTGILLRVRETGDAEGWEVLEAPSGWQGIMQNTTIGVLEEADGTLLLAGDVGVVVVPPGARESRPRAPAVQLIEVRGSEGPPSDGSGDRLVLPHGRNWMELSFAALSFREPSAVRYRVRLGPDAQGTDTQASTVRFVDVASGAHQAEILASVDGVHWSPEPARFAFQVHRPWYLHPAAWLCFVLGLAAAAVCVQRARLLVRLRLERQRARIAMDLHDELGSGLGSIGILASLVADGALGPEERREVHERIATIASELGGSLGDIVWSLRPTSNRLDTLVAHITERATRLFPGGCPELVLCLPERVPALPLELTACRALQLIAAEALHNARKHAGASRVFLGLACEGKQWCLWVADDGHGHTGSDTRGLGLSSMRTRAQEMGAELIYLSEPEGGTLVAVPFPGPSGSPPRALRAWLAREAR